MYDVELVRLSFQLMTQKLEHNTATFNTNQKPSVARPSNWIRVNKNLKRKKKKQ